MFFGSFSRNFSQQILVVTSHNFGKLLTITSCFFKFEKSLTVRFNLSLGSCVVSIVTIFLLNGVFQQLTCIVL